MVIRYGVPKWGGPRRSPDAGPPLHVNAAEEIRTPTSSRTSRRALWGLASVLLHAAAIAALLIAVTPPLPLPSPDAAPIELVFEQPAPIPAALPEPEPPDPVAAPPPLPEQPPQPTPEQPPQPIAPPPEPIPPPEAPLPQPAPAPLEPARPVRPPPPKPSAMRPPLPRRTERPPAAAPPRAEPGPQPPAAGPAAPSPPVMDRGWVAAVSAWLSAHRTYPAQARDRGEQGNVAVRFTVDRSGRVLEATIVSASGSSLLDEAALRLLRQAAFPPFPAVMTQAQVTVTTSIRYSLQ